ncbi:mismatch-specific DNA-glycosylase [Alicyclobacillus acidiphilus]|uniref:mismatch-specific DNA-glycosylase n=1 Tax=Alicyclobacillus acidiphilus TaxID=182455 RepID=UPI000A417928|nr:mismatch-specific DNA-glycosylase [Alicyclobacillus acidiphilus]
MDTEILAAGMQLLFVGFNPSPKSAETGWNYAGPNNRFYRILLHAGLTRRLFHPSEGRTLLAEYGYGFTNLVKRPTRLASEVTREEYVEGAKRLGEVLNRYEPDMVCFVGKGVYLPFASVFHLPRKVDWGFLQTEHSFPARLFVGPGTSGLVRMKFDDQVAIYRELATALDSAKSSTET